MPRFLIGDELGNIKALHLSEDPSQESKWDIKVLHTLRDRRPCEVQQLAALRQEENNLNKTLISASLSDGYCFLSTLTDENNFQVLSQWNEPRISGNKFIGMSLTNSWVYACTSNGLLRRTSISSGPLHSESASLPTRLSTWRLSESGDHFAYGGEEVDLSVWDCKLAFQAQTNLDLQTTKKRKRGDDLFPAEIWRARNVPNDSLGLRQPIRITALTFLSSSPLGHHLLAGNQFGELRQYDTRAARKPISKWTGLAKVGGIKSIEQGLSANEIFLSDNGSNLFSVDLRTGGVLYGFRGISGTVTAIAPSPSILVSTALDKYIRIHSTVPPPSEVGSPQNQKAELIEKKYLSCTPTTVIWDRCTKQRSLIENSNEDEVWDKMKSIS